MKHSLRLNSVFKRSVFSEKKNLFFSSGVKGQVAKPLIDSGGAIIGIGNLRRFFCELSAKDFLEVFSFFEKSEDYYP